MRNALIVASMLFVSCACMAQTQGRAAVSKGDKTVVGCVAQGGQGFELRLDNGRTFPLRSGRDLTGFVGKKVQIHAEWEETGVTLAAPVEEGTSPSPSAGSDAGATDMQRAFAGDLHLKLTGKVLGDCLPGKK